MSADGAQPPWSYRVCYGLLAVNLTVAVIAALLLAAIRSTVKAVQVGVQAGVLAPKKRFCQTAGDQIVRKRNGLEGDHGDQRQYELG